MFEKKKKNIVEKVTGGSEKGGVFKKKKNIAEKVADKTEELEPEIREMVIGKNTIFSLLSFGIGTVLLGNFIWELSSFYLGSFVTAGLGLVLFVVGGVISHEFRK